MPSSSPERLAYSPAEAAALLGLSRATIYNLMKRSELRFVKIANSTRIPYSELERLSGNGAA